MKKFAAMLILIMLLITNTVQASILLEYNGQTHEYTGSLYKLKVNGKYIKTPLEPIIVNDRALVPVREVFEAMGAQVGYVPETKEITVSFMDTYIKLKIGSEKAIINKNEVTIPDSVVPMLIAKKGESAKTMVPVRFVSEKISMHVVFDGDKNEIRIINPGQDFIDEPEEPEYSSTVKSVSAKVSDSKTQVVVKMDKKAEKIGNLTYIESSQVLYVDIFGASNEANPINDLAEDCVKSVRIGQHEEYTRIALDTQNVYDYKKSLSTDGKTLTITVSANQDIQGEELPDENTDEKPPQSEENVPPSFITGEKIVIIDAGHGGHDGGAVYKHGQEEYVEKDINLQVAKKVTNILKREGIRVEMTRSSDTYPTLWERSELANELGGAMFVSIHSNASQEAPKANGIEVYYSKQNNSDRYNITSKDLANDILRQMISKTNAYSRGVKTADHVVTRTCDMPAVLIELGFLSNKAEAQNMSDSSYQDLLASGIANAIIENLEFVKIPPEPKPEPVDNQEQPEKTEQISE